VQQSLTLDEMLRKAESETQETVVLCLRKAQASLGRATSPHEAAMLRELYSLPEEQQEAASARLIRTGKI